LIGQNPPQYLRGFSATPDPHIHVLPYEAQDKQAQFTENVLYERPAPALESLGFHVPFRARESIRFSLIPIWD